MKISEQDTLSMFEKRENCNGLSASRGQAIPMGNNLPPVMLAGFPSASLHIPKQKLGSEIQEAPVGNQSNEVGNPLKRKRYHRYSELQVRALQAFFEKCPRPDRLQRKELGDALGIDPMKVKFWFQNMHTKLKLQLEHKNNKEYRAENQKLLFENLKLKQTLAVCTCETCGSPLVNQDIKTSLEDLLKLENNKLREQIKRIASTILKFDGNPWASSKSIPSPLSRND